MSRIMFRQKTPEEVAADAAAKQRRELTATKIEDSPSATVLLPAEKAPADVAPAFLLDGEADMPEAKKGRRK